MCPEEYRERMVPKHREPFTMFLVPYSLTRRISAPGCKRLMLDSNYLASLSRPNLTPNFNSISRITENGILTNDGKCQLT
jgi:cation diffusion facilitator CzcD-associated flavoprotein CzcO